MFEAKQAGVKPFFFYCTISLRFLYTLSEIQTSKQSQDGEKNMVARIHDLWVPFPFRLSGLRTVSKIGVW